MERPNGKPNDLRNPKFRRLRFFADYTDEEAEACLRGELRGDKFSLGIAYVFGEDSKDYDEGPGGGFHLEIYRLGKNTVYQLMLIMLEHGYTSFGAAIAALAEANYNAKVKAQRAARKKADPERAGAKEEPKTIPFPGRDAFMDFARKSRLYRRGKITEKPEMDYDPG